LFKGTIKVDASQPAKIALTLVVDPSVIYSNVSGKVIGYSKLPQGNHKVVLRGMGLMTRPESAIGADGSFAFSNIPSGTYEVSLLPEVADAQTVIQVVNKEVTHAELTVP